MTSGFIQNVECPSWHAKEFYIYKSLLFVVRTYLFLHLHDKYYVIFNVIPPSKDGKICNSMQYFCSCQHNTMTKENFKASEL